METKPNDQIQSLGEEGHDNHNHGLTKRELFAAMAMQGLCSNSTTGSHKIPVNMAKEAIEHADSLIAELNKDKNGN